MIINSSAVKTIVTMGFLMSFGFAWNMENKYFVKVKKYYDISKENKTLNEINTINDRNYWEKRNDVLALISSSVTADIFLKKAIMQSDIKMIEFLFEKGANPNQTKLGYEDPVFFNANNKNILKLFKDQGADLNQPGARCPNISWSNILHNPSSEFIKSCVEFNVNTKTIDSYNGDCLLHFLVKHPGRNIKTVNDYVKIGEIVIKEISGMVNKLNDAGNTPIDEALQIIHKGASPMVIEANKRLIALFEKYNGKAVNEISKMEQYKSITKLSKEQPVIKAYSPCCIICLDSFENLKEVIIDIPCLNKHEDKVCVKCYGESLKFSSTCPLCRSALK